MRAGLGGFSHGCFSRLPDFLDPRLQSTCLRQQVRECSSSLIVWGQRRAGALAFLPFNESCSGRGLRKRVERELRAWPGAAPWDV